VERSLTAPRHSLLWLALAVLMIGAVACAASGGAQKALTGGEAADFWSQAPWHGGGVQVASPADAQQQLPFHMLTPRAPDGLRGIYLPPGGRPSDLMAVWFVYKSAKYGWVWVSQSLPDVSDPAQRQAGWGDDVAHDGDPGAPQCEVTTIRGATQSLLCTSDSGGTLEWVEDGVQFRIMGPTLTRQDLLGLANGL
jgi:hypothetical protein